MQQATDPHDIDGDDPIEVSADAAADDSPPAAPLEAAVADASAEDAGPPIEDVLREGLAGLETQVRRFHERSARHEEIIREMQSRITDLQGDQIQSLLKPALQRFAGLHAQAADARDSALERGEKAAKDFSFFVTAIEDALGLIDLDSVDATIGMEFDPASHHATSTVATSDVRLDRTVQRVIRQGFTYADAMRVTIPAQVVVYRYDEPTATDTDEHPIHEETDS